jgi:hypothetical protein
VRFMLVVIFKGNVHAAADMVSGAEAAGKMMEYNKSLQQAGVLLAFDGLSPASTGARVSYLSGKATVTGGPFAEAKEVVGGYWIIQVRSREEAVEWARRAPMSLKFARFTRWAISRKMRPAAAEGLEGVPNGATAKA